MILVVDTASNSETFIGLFDEYWLSRKKWSSGRNLSADILNVFEGLYKEAEKSFNDTQGVIVSSGPGSFTGLRIGLSVANTFAYSLDIPIVGVSAAKNTDDLLITGKKALDKLKKFEKVVAPVYGSEPNITKPKKK
jgi:tRNA threonylcarbamoyladenosine biosynthesis protein TsaB